MAEIKPPPPRHTVGELRAILAEGAPDPEWASDIESAVAAGKAMPPEDPWAER